jgi:hypothetical protein
MQNRMKNYFIKNTLRRDLSAWLHTSSSTNEHNELEVRHQLHSYETADKISHSVSDALFSHVTGMSHFHIRKI